METCADLKEAGDTSAGADSARGGGGNLTEEFEQGTLARAVLADDADHIALLDLEIDIAQCPYILAIGFLGTVVDGTNLQIRVFTAEDTGLPPTVEVVGNGARGDES